MHRVLAASIAALALVVAVPATAATPAEKRIAKLEQQTKTLTKQVTALQKQVKQLTGFVVFNFAADACEATASADAFAATWSAIDRIGATQATPTTYFGPQAAIDDKKSCSDIEIARQTAAPPTLSSFVSLINALYG
jgi:cytochrome c556